MEIQKHISPLSIWSFSVGTSIGWGAFFITSNTYLINAGPAGSISGLLIGCFVMLFIAHNYQFMMNRFPDSGGLFSYTKNILGYDYAFLTALFLVLTYIAMFWANATSIPLFARYFLGDLFKFGNLYSLFGYKIYLGEALLSIATIILTGFLCSKKQKLAAAFMSILVLLFTIGILFCFVFAIFSHKNTNFSFSPVFVPSSKELSQILKIAFISPWAFIGFENISHFVPEFNFSPKKSGNILRFSIITTTVLYIALILISITAYPAEYESWLSYIKDLPNLEGIKGLPVFYATSFYLGKTGVYILIFTLLSLIVTSLIGNIFALSRLLFSLSQNKLISSKLSVTSKNGSPEKAIWLIVAISAFVPFLGRTAIGWIVDVTTIGATIIYGFLSFSTFKLAKAESKKLEVFTGCFSLVMMAVFFVFLIVPNFFAKGTISSESYFLFSVWSIIGFLFFHNLLKTDKERIYGKSNIVWIFLLSLILVLTLVWMIKIDQNAIETGISKFQEYMKNLSENGENLGSVESYLTLSLRLAFKNIFEANLKTSLVVIALFLVTTFIIISNTNIIKKREVEHEHEIYKTRSIAYKDSLTSVKSKHAYSEYEAKINQEIAEETTKEFSVVVCDVNNLKWVNDNLGHKAGDEYIKEACHAICVIFDHSPVFRTGGDEFVVVLKGHDYEHRSELLQNLNKISEENNGQNGKVVVAAGISDYSPSTDSSISSVFERADSNMYIRKKQLKDMLK